MDGVSPHLLSPTGLTCSSLPIQIRQGGAVARQDLHCTDTSTMLIFGEEVIKRDVTERGGNIIFY